jgi:uncharacterized protein
MQITGTASLQAPPGRVSAALRDPAVLAAVIPGCERLEPAGPGSYRVTIRTDLAPIQGSYAAQIRVSPERKPACWVLTASGAGNAGTVTASARIGLDDSADGGSTLSYEADTELDGALAAVGQRLLSSVATRLAGDFFAAVNDHLSGNAVVRGQPAPAAAVSPADTATTRQRDGSAPDAAAVPPAPASQGFVRGVVVGAAGALAAVAVAAIARRRGR